MMTRARRSEITNDGVGLPKRVEAGTRDLGHPHEADAQGDDVEEPHRDFDHRRIVVDHRDDGFADEHHQHEGDDAPDEREAVRHGQRLLDPVVEPRAPVLPTNGSTEDDTDQRIMCASVSTREATL